MESFTVRVSLPAHLRRLSGVSASAVAVEVAPSGGEPVTLATVLDALEQAYPALRGTIRDHPAAGSDHPGTLRPFMRFFASEEDITSAGQSAPIPPEVLSGKEVLRIIGAIAGGCEGKKQTFPSSAGLQYPVGEEFEDADDTSSTEEARDHRPSRSSSTPIAQQDCEGV